MAEKRQVWMRRGAMARWVVAVAVLAALAAAPAAGAPEQTPKRGGTVVFGPVGEPNCLNPVGGLLYGRSAVRLDPREGPRAGLHRGSRTSPGSRLSSPAFGSRAGLPFTLLFDIRREARWSDGVPVTARDFLFTHRAILERSQQVTSLVGLTTSCGRSTVCARRPFESSSIGPSQTGETYLSSSCRGTRSLGTIPDRSGKRTLRTRERDVRSAAARSSSRTSSAAQAAHARAQSSVLGTAHRSSRPAGRPLLQVVLRGAAHGGGAR